MKVTRRLRPVRALASRMRAHFSGVVVIGFSVMTSQPAFIARMMYSSWVESMVVTITISGFVSVTIFSKSAGR